MGNKICTKCNKSKSISEFGLLKNGKDGLMPHCKICDRLKLSNYNKTKDGVISRMFSSQTNGRNSMGKIKPIYTKQELKKWLFSQDLFNELYDSWVDSGYEKDLKPSIDRIKNDVGYELGNIQIMTFRQNKEKAYSDTRLKSLSNSGLLHGGHKKVIQMDKDNNFIEEFISLNEASRITSIPVQRISDACNGKNHKHTGFNWIYG